MEDIEYISLSSEEIVKLEEMRGTKIQMFDSNETILYEDLYSEELMKINPLVTVKMLTYNQERYIGQAIEGVIKQECDFPIELLIIEDHSSDGTLEICKKYQKQYPNKIRLLSAKERKPFVLSRISTAFIRGKYLAFCEGDDYWTSVNKLKVQVDVLEKYQSINLVCTDYRIFFQDQNRFVDVDVSKEGIIRNLHKEMRSENGQHHAPFQTAGILIRAKSYNAYNTTLASRMRLSMGDYQLFLWNTFPDGKYYVVPEKMYVYRKCDTGVSFNYSSLMNVDTCIAAYIFRKCLFPEYQKDDVYLALFCQACVHRCIGDKSQSNLDSIISTISNLVNKIVESKAQYPLAVINLHFLIAFFVDNSNLITIFNKKVYPNNEFIDVQYMLKLYSYIQEDNYFGARNKSRVDDVNELLEIIKDIGSNHRGFPLTVATLKEHAVKQWPCWFQFGTKEKRVFRAIENAGIKLKVNSSSRIISWINDCCGYYTANKVQKFTRRLFH